MASTIPVLCANAQSVPADYKAYFDALEAQKASRYVDVLESLEIVWQFRPESPLKGKAAVLAANCYLALERAADAVAVLRQNKSSLDQPQGNVALAKALEAYNDPAGAAALWQSVYYGNPASDDAVAAEAALRRLQTALGDRYPPAMPAAVFDRAEKLRKAGQQGRAKSELLAAASNFGGLERELAMVRAHSGDYRVLSTLRVTNPESEAEKLYLMHAAARRNSMEMQAEAAMRQLDTRFPESKWTMEALISWANHHVLRNNPAGYIPLYRACYERFPDDPQAAYCHWRVSWGMWITRDPNAPAMLQEHAARFPDSENRGAALYFSGRYEEILSKHPMSFYAGLARAKWQGPMPAANPDPALFTPGPVTKLRIGRARQLQTAGLSDWTEFELKFAAREQPFVAAMELAEWAADRGNHDQALRFIKGISKDYLKLPLTAAPERFWKLAFPLPWRSEVETAGHDHGIEPPVLAALIRQESEFNPRAVSRAKAYGLTQVLPSTGRGLSRRAGIHGFHTAMLFDPEVNLKLGTMHLRQMLDAHGGQWEFTLSTYNAGKSRTNLWQTWYTYREPAEFIETIPFSETRNYVQAVLRNADVYRRIYGRPLSASTRK